MALSAVVSKSSIEFRKYLRVTPLPDKPIRVDINGEDFIEILHVMDISEGGIGIRVPYGFAGCRIHELVSFVLALPSKRHALLHFAGKIEHVSGDRFGVKFSHVPEDAHQLVRKYIESRLWEMSPVEWLRYKVYRARQS